MHQPCARANYRRLVVVSRVCVDCAHNRPLEEPRQPNLAPDPTLVLLLFIARAKKSSVGTTPVAPVPGLSKREQHTEPCPPADWIRTSFCDALQQPTLHLLA